MHALFHTSNPPFRYQTEQSLRIAEQVLKGKGPSANGVITQDAGANLHVFFPEQERDQWKAFAEKFFPQIPILIDQQGTGAKLL